MLAPSTTKSCCRKRAQMSLSMPMSHIPQKHFSRLALHGFLRELLAIRTPRCLFWVVITELSSSILWSAFWMGAHKECQLPWNFPMQIGTWTWWYSLRCIWKQEVMQACIIMRCQMVRGTSGSLSGLLNPEGTNSTFNLYFLKRSGEQNDPIYFLCSLTGLAF